MIHCRHDERLLYRRLSIVIVFREALRRSVARGVASRAPFSSDCVVGCKGGLLTMVLLVLTPCTLR